MERAGEARPGRPASARALVGSSGMTPAVRDVGVAASPAQVWKAVVYQVIATEEHVDAPSNVRASVWSLLELAPPGG